MPDHFSSAGSWKINRRLARSGWEIFKVACHPHTRCPNRVWETAPSGGAGSRLMKQPKPPKLARGTRGGSLFSAFRRRQGGSGLWVYQVTPFLCRHARPPVSTHGAPLVEPAFSHGHVVEAGHRPSSSPARSDCSVLGTASALHLFPDITSALSRSVHTRGGPGIFSALERPYLVSRQ